MGVKGLNYHPLKTGKNKIKGTCQVLKIHCMLVSHNLKRGLSCLY